MIADVDTTVRDAELSVLGSVLLTNSTLDVAVVEEGLRPEHFELPQHAGAYRAMLALTDEGEPVDVLTLASHGVPRALLDTAYAAAMPTYARQHARLVIAEHRWRARRESVARQQQAIGDRDDHAYQAAVTVTEPDRAPNALHTPAQLAAGLEAFLDDPNRNVVPLPWEPLNSKIAGGLFAGNTTVLSGFSSHGKSVVAMQTVEHIANLNGHAGFYTNEMPPGELYARHIAAVAEVEFARIMARQLTADERDRIRQAGKFVFFPIIDARGWPVTDVCRHLRRSKWDLAVFDLFNALPGRDDLQATDAAIYALRDAAGISGCHLIVVCQLNRGRDDKAMKPAPTLRDLRETGSLEHAPANVMFVHREQEEIRDAFSNELTGRTRRLHTGVVYFAKARNGDPDAAVDVRLDPKRMRFDLMKAAV